MAGESGAPKDISAVVKRVSLLPARAVAQLFVRFRHVASLALALELAFCLYYFGAARVSGSRGGFRGRLGEGLVRLFGVPRDYLPGEVFSW